MRNPTRYHLKIREEKKKKVEEENWSLFAEEDAAAAAKKAKKKSRYGNFDTILDHFSRSFRLYTIPRASYHVSYL